MSLRTLLRVVAVLCLLAVLGGIWAHSESVTAVEVGPVDGPLEIDDGVLGGEPDLRLDLRVGGSWKELGVFRDQPLGEGRRWEVPAGVARSALIAVRLVEDDPARDDVIAEEAVTGPSFQGPTVRFELETARDLWVGTRWFLLTPLGLALLAGVLLGTFVSFVLEGGSVVEAAADALG